MSETQSKLGNALLKSLITLREQKGEVKIDDIGEILESMASSLHNETPTHAFLRNEITKLAEYIGEAKAEIMGMLPEDEESPRHLGKAGMELSEVVKATEQAANDIMDATEEIQNLIAKLPKVSETKAIMDASQRIFDACNFQDITGQRVSKVAKTLEYVEAKINKIVSLFSDSPYGNLTISELDQKFADVRPDAELMSGPQLKPPSQEEIDALFGSIAKKA